MEENKNGARLLVLLECGDVFKQVILTSKQFKRVSDAVIRDWVEPDDNGYQDVCITLGEQEVPIDIFEGMTDIDDDGLRPENP